MTKTSKRTNDGLDSKIRFPPSLVIPFYFQCAEVISKYFVLLLLFKVQESQSNLPYCHLHWNHRSPMTWRKGFRLWSPGLCLLWLAVPGSQGQACSPLDPPFTDKWEPAVQTHVNICPMLHRGETSGPTCASLLFIFTKSTLTSEWPSTCLLFLGTEPRHKWYLLLKLCSMLGGWIYLCHL